MEIQTSEVGFDFFIIRVRSWDGGLEPARESGVFSFAALGSDFYGAEGFAGGGYLVRGEEVG